MYNKKKKKKQKNIFNHNNINNIQYISYNLIFHNIVSSYKSLLKWEGKCL